MDGVNTVEQFSQCTPDELTAQKVLDRLRTDPVCKFDRNKIDNDSDRYTDYVNARNNQDCPRIGAKYLHVDKDMRLLPDQRWNVPYKSPPVCWGNNRQYRPLIDQTALIGTLLNEAADTRVGSILPDFSYRENSTYPYPRKDQRAVCSMNK